MIFKHLVLGIVVAAMFPIGVLATVPNIPQLNWQPRSDWINVKTDVTPAAVGDGKADDTAAIQAALNGGARGKTIFLPPGTYRITQTLSFHGPGSGSAIIGAGRDTLIVWDGAEGGRMFWSDGVGYSRYVGLVWDGRNKAAIGFEHAAKAGFETEIEHIDEAFLNFTNYGIRIGYQQKFASAEILYRNCLFENCETGLGFLRFNDYDNSIDRCEFRDCGVGVIANKSNFYARNCHFENSHTADFIVDAEHGCSIRRCTSIGAKCFVVSGNGIAPLTIEDCHVSRWTDPEGAVRLKNPALMFDCTFSDPPSSRPPVVLAGTNTKLLVSDNQPALINEKTPGTNRIYVIPAGKLGCTVTSASQEFLMETEDVSGKVFDAVRDFGAKGDGMVDDTSAIQSAIDAARQSGHGAFAYLPTGRYLVSNTLLVTGSDYTLSGSGIRCGLVWRGKAGDPIIKVSGVMNVRLANFAVGNSDYGKMDHGDDILVTSPSNIPCRLILDGIDGYGKYQQAPDKHGIHFIGLPKGSVVDATGVQGNLRITDCASADLLFRTSYEGAVTIEGASSSHDGLTGFLTRLATQGRPALRVFDNQSVVMSDFYVEGSEQIAVLMGTPGQEAGAVTIQQPKAQTSGAGLMFDIHNYAGRIYCGQSQFYYTPAETKFQSSGTSPLRLILAGNNWVKNQPAFDLKPATQLTLLGNSNIADSGVDPEGLAGASAALDDLRRLGNLDDNLPSTTP